MTKRTLLFMVLVVAATFLVNVPGACWAQSTDNTGINKRDQSKEELTAGQQGETKADNTGINKRDRSKEELTAGQQGETKQDRDITQKIRRAIVTDKSLSTNAHNVKIITVGGMVTLKGPVGSEEEKRIVEEKAAQIAGKDNVKSEIGIAPKKTTK